MTNKQTLIFILVLFSTFGHGQKLKKFNLFDSVFYVGSRYTTWQIIYTDSKDETFEPESMKFIDSIVWFMTKHPNITIEIEDHRDKNSLYQNSFNSAKNIVGVLIKKGIYPSRLSAKGFAGIRPFVPDSVIKRAKTKETAEAMRLKCRRTALKVNCVNCISKERLKKARSLSDLVPERKFEGGRLVWDSNGIYMCPCELSVWVKGLSHNTRRISEPLSAEARTIIDLAEIGSQIYLDCYCPIIDRRLSASIEVIR
jgi:hypothetical protein